MVVNHFKGRKIKAKVELKGTDEQIYTKLQQMNNELPYRSNEYYRLANSDRQKAYEDWASRNPNF